LINVFIFSFLFGKLVQQEREKMDQSVNLSDHPSKGSSVVLLFLKDIVVLISVVSAFHLFWQHMIALCLCLFTWL